MSVRLVMMLFLLAVTLLVSGTAYAETQTYSDGQYGFSFSYPATHAVRPATYGTYADVIDSQGRTVLRVEVEDLDRYPRNEYRSVQDPLWDFGLKRALLRCLADGPDGSTSCPSENSTNEYVNPQGIRILEAYLNYVEEYRGIQPRRSISVMGPVFLADISQKGKVIVLVMSGASSARLDQNARELTEHIVDSLRFGVAPEGQESISGYPYLDKHYEPVISLSDVIYDKEFTLTLYNIQADSELQPLDVPRSIVVVQSRGKSRRLPMEQTEPMESIRYVVPNTNEPLIGIPNPRGGNCWNCNGYHLLTLGDNDLLGYYGTASGFLDLDGNGIDEPVRYEDIWEKGLGLLSHADAPGVAVPLSLLAGKLVPAAMLHRDYYEAELVRITTEIEKYPSLPPKADNARLLSLILQKFLIHRLLDQTDRGWQDFELDIRHYGSEFFFLRIKGVTKRYRIADLRRKIERSLL